MNVSIVLGTVGRMENTRGNLSSRFRILRISTDTESEACSDEFMENLEEPEFKFVEQPHSAKILSGLDELRKCGEFCDITLSVDGTRFPAHKVVLASFSPYFRAMFSSSLAESKQNVVTLNGLDSCMVGMLLDYAYTSEILITRANVQALLSAANLLQVIPVKEAACRFLGKHMDCMNCIGIHCFGELHSCSDLQDKAKTFILENFSDVIKHEEFLTLTPSKLSELVSDDYLQVEQEEVVFEAVFRWYKAKPDDRSVVFGKILENVRLSLISPYYLVDCVEKLDVVRDNPECLSLTAEAKLYHLLPDRRHERESIRSKPRLSSDTIEVIVAVGGEDDKVVLRVVECFCPATKKWKSLKCVPIAISKHGLVSSGKNALFLAGGEFPDGGASQRVYRYDPVLDYWQEVESMSIERSELGLAMLDGYLYAVGGWEGFHRLNSVERYDPSSNTWTDVAPMNTAVTSAAVVAHDGMLYVTGGAVFEDGDGIDLVQRYNPRTDSWTEVAPMKIPRSGAAICALGSEIYVVGGWHAATENTNRVECYNVKTNTWEFKSSMHKKRYRPGIAVMDGKIYVLGGEEGLDKYHDSIEVYDPLTDTWSLCGKMLTSRSWHGCVPLRVRKSICQDKCSPLETAVTLSGIENPIAWSYAP